jgi:hypothetical protein
VIAAQHAHAAGSLQRETTLVLRAYELGALTRAEVDELAERHRAAPHPEPETAPPPPGPAAAAQETELAQLPR